MLIYPYKPGSQSAKALSLGLNAKRIKHEGSKLKGRANKLVVNWGSSALPAEVAKCIVINAPEAVSKASNKLSFFKAVVGRVSVPTFVTERAEALKLVNEGHCLVARTILNGNSGAGIVLIGGDGKFGYKEEELVDAPLYTVYVPKKQEYRVHVFRGQVLDVQRKARKQDVPDDEVNWKIRNMANGFIFARGEDALGQVPQDVIDQAVLAVETLGLDFGAADVIYNDKQAKAYVLEVNTAPGLSGTTLDNYVKAFKELV